MNVDRLPVEDGVPALRMPLRFDFGCEAVLRLLNRSKVSERRVSSTESFAGHDYHSGALAQRGFKMNTVNAVSKH